MKKKINEIFYSIQGEGCWAGTAMVFVRFSGCNLKCDFCDTEHQSYTEMTNQEILEEVSKHKCLIVCLTGGEPALQADQTLIDLLHENQKIVHIETNGTIELPNNINWVTVSPKTDNIKPKIVHEIKVVYQGQDVSKWLNSPATLYYLQPCSCTNTDEVIKYIKTHTPWKLSIQTQKLLNFQ